ncbi:MAG: manganese-binding transcriptional regulator MntR [Pirellulales bacterium]
MRSKSSWPADASLLSRRFHRIREDHSTEVAEDYLELIDDLIEETGEARAVDLAVRMGVHQVTVTKAIGRLKRDGLVTSAPYRSIFLTAQGKRIAIRSRKRHRTVLDFLLALGVDREVAVLDAEGMEHHISPATMAAMRRFVKQDGAKVCRTVEGD